MTTVATKPAQIRVTRPSQTYWRVTIDNPPLNVMGPEMVRQFQETIDALESDKHVKVVVSRWSFGMKVIEILKQSRGSENIRPRSSETHDPEHGGRSKGAKPTNDLEQEGYK